MKKLIKRLLKKDKGVKAIQGVSNVKVIINGNVKATFANMEQAIESYPALKD